ncbi:hypothetical protein FACS1894132_13160 [Clostridia bacterium]|nr:hypothetical protein FACS1894132_13160 [Clostridia bacterium]
MSTKSTTIRINNDVKNDVTPILSELGISLSEAVNMFLHQVKLRRGIPFDLILNETELAVAEAIYEADNHIGESFNSWEQAKEWLNA